MKPGGSLGRPKKTAEPRERNTLASGRPGSRAPLSEARPPGAHTHSVAEENPHGDTKLSSASGLTQERLEESMANTSGERGRPIAETE